MDRFRIAQSTPPTRQHAGLTCSLGISDTTSNEGLRKRLAWLQDFVNQQNLFGDWKPIEQVVTGTDLSRATNQLHSEGQKRNAEPLATTSPVTFSTLTPPATAPSPSLPATAYSNNEDDAASSDLRPAKRIRLLEPTITEQPPNATSSSTNATAPPTEFTPIHIKEPDARALVDAYFLDVNRAYPFVNRSMVLDALQANGNRIPPLRDCEATSTILYLIMAIGFTSLQRAGQVPPTTQWHFPIEYKEVLSECIIQETINTVQILLLLAIYSAGHSNRPDAP
ncbi:Rac GTPase-activating protein BCR/ABR [Neocucurbitaria cava]|uniref:Rac GTPase-activating protein BCR/ABR n=1 Tax=Neocucurbitaria cava TaxID=798079 RepID=A0A9W8Y564_9PLEO|nr:Rac GTPase-activating protein BCR/ABR [Neocucurbitaria cava]